MILIFQEVSKTIEKQIKNFGIYFDSRFYIGLGFFIIPSLLCLWSPPNVIALVFPNKYMQHKLSLLQVNIIGDVPFDDVGEIISGSKVSQSFLASHDELHAISVLMATYARKNSSKIKFTLLNQDHKKIYSQELGTGTISDNTYLNFIFPVISKSKGNVFYFELSSVDASAGNAITVYRTKTKNYSDGILLVNKTLVAGDLVMKIYYNKPV